MKTRSSLLLWSSSFFAIVGYNVLTMTTPAYGVEFVNTLKIDGETPDLIPGNGANVNRLGFFSDLYYDRTNNVYYGLSDRGPGGGLINYNTRVQKFTLNVDLNTGAISNFTVQQTILFTRNGNNFNGLNPQLLTGNASNLGNSFDPEGFVLAPNGNFYVSDEYGPSVYEFNPDGTFVREFSLPNNLIPRDANGNINYIAGRTSSPALINGRQDNRGFEGLTITPDGSKLLAMLQDPLINEGDNNEGRRSQNLRIVEFDIVTGQSTAQYIYQLESIEDINDRIPGDENDFGATSQGRNIGISAIIALSNTEFLVLERDNRGFGVDEIIDDEPGIRPVGSKRVYRINISGATDVSNISLAGSSLLPNGVIPVSKRNTPFLDVAAELTAAGEIIPEKLEGLTIGPQLNDGSFLTLLGTDNDYSVTQTGSGTQFDVCTNEDGTSVTQVAIDSDCPNGQSLIPGYLYAFKTPSRQLRQTPEPSTLVGLLLVGLSSLLFKRIK